jgi:predicted methyltransferase
MLSKPHRSRWLVVSTTFLMACSPAASPTASTPAHAEHAEHAEHAFHKDFSDAEGYSARFDDPARDAWQRPEDVLDLMQIPRGSTVVDLGAGTGYFVSALARRVGDQGKVLALDVEPKMIAFLERRVKEQKLTNVKPQQVSTDDPALPAASTSRILIVNTWHHIDERPSYAKKLAAALAPDGEIWIVDFTLDADQGPPAKYRLSPEQVTRELEQGGLHAEVVTPEPLPKQYIVRAFR